MGGMLLNPYFALSPFVTDGLVLNLDASNLSSYPGTGSTWFDTSGNGKNYSIPANATWNPAGYFSITAGTSFSGPSSNSFGFGNENYIEVVVSPSANGETTFFQWAATPSVGVDPRSISSHLPWTDGSLFYDTYGCCDVTQRISVGGQVPLNQKKHYSFITRRAYTPNREVYRNNSSIVTSGTNSTGTSTWNLTTPSYLAGSWSGTFYCIRAYNRALTDSERLKNYTYDQVRFGLV